jgi:hypothetical protein
MLVTICTVLLLRMLNNIIDPICRAQARQGHAEADTLPRWLDAIEGDVCRRCMCGEPKPTAEGCCLRLCALRGDSPYGESAGAPMWDRLKDSLIIHLN